MNNAINTKPSYIHILESPASITLVSNSPTSSSCTFPPPVSCPPVSNLAELLCQARRPLQGCYQGDRQLKGNDIYERLTITNVDTNRCQFSGYLQRVQKHVAVDSTVFTCTTAASDSDLSSITHPSLSATSHSSAASSSSPSALPSPATSSSSSLLDPIFVVDPEFGESLQLQKGTYNPRTGGIEFQTVPAVSFLQEEQTYEGFARWDDFSKQHKIEGSWTNPKAGVTHAGAFCFLLDTQTLVVNHDLLAQPATTPMLPSPLLHSTSTTTLTPDGQFLVSPFVATDRKVIKITAANRKKPVVKVNHSTAAQHSCVTSLALVFRMLTLQELVRVHRSCHLWRDAAESPITFPLRWSFVEEVEKNDRIEAKGQLLKVNGTALSQRNGISISIQFSQLVRQFRGVELMNLSTETLNQLSGFPQLQHLKINLHQAQQLPAFASFPVSLRSMQVQLDTVQLALLFKCIAHFAQMQQLELTIQNSGTSEETYHCFPESFAEELLKLNNLQHLLIGAVSSHVNGTRSTLQLSSADQRQLSILSHRHSELTTISCTIPMTHCTFTPTSVAASNIGSSDEALVLKDCTRITMGEIVSADDFCKDLQLFPHLTALNILDWAASGPQGECISGVGENDGSRSLFRAGVMLMDPSKLFPSWPTEITRNLMELNLQSTIDPNVLCYMLSGAGLKCLRILHLASSSNPVTGGGVTTQALTAFCQSLPDLRKLSFRVATLLVDSLEMFRHMSRLEFLAYLHWPEDVKHDTLAVAFPSLTYLHVTGDSMKELPLAEYYEPLLTMPSLKSVQWCQYPTLSIDKLQGYFNRFTSSPLVDPNRMGLNINVQAIVDHSRCSTNLGRIYESAYRCQTCSMDPHRMLCAACARCCHAGHTLTIQPTNITSTCDCAKDTVANQKSQYCLLQQLQMSPIAALAANMSTTFSNFNLYSPSLTSAPLTTTSSVPAFPFNAPIKPSSNLFSSPTSSSSSSPPPVEHHPIPALLHLAARFLKPKPAASTVTATFEEEKKQQ